jgi:hypothetical protein
VEFGLRHKTGGTSLAESDLAAQQPKALTSYFDSYVHQQIKAPKKGRDTKLKDLGILPPEDKGRLKFHTEAKWYNSEEFRDLTAGAIRQMQLLLLQLLPPARPAPSASAPSTSSAPPPDPLEQWPAWQEEYGGGADVPDQVLTSLLGPQIERVITVLINRSSCTSCSGYCGGCAQEGADTVRKFWAKVAGEMGAPLAGLLEATSTIQFRSSVAARDTNAGDKTVSVPLAHGLDVQVHQKYDFARDAPQPIDRNQIDLIKLIRKEKAALAEKSPEVFDEGRPGAAEFKEYKAAMLKLKAEGRGILEAVLAATPSTTAEADKALAAGYESLLAVLKKAVRLTFEESPVPAEVGASEESYLTSFQGTYEEALAIPAPRASLAASKLLQAVIELSGHFDDAVDEMIYEWELSFLAFPAPVEEEPHAL